MSVGSCRCGLLFLSAVGNIAIVYLHMGANLCSMVRLLHGRERFRDYGDIWLYIILYAAYYTFPPCHLLLFKSHGMSADLSTMSLTLGRPWRWSFEFQHGPRHLYQDLFLGSDKLHWLGAKQSQWQSQKSFGWSRVRDLVYSSYHFISTPALLFAA